MNTEWRQNKFDAFCSACGTEVPALQGFYDANATPRKFYCAQHRGVTEPQAPPLKRAPIVLAPGAVSVDDVAHRTAELTYERVALHFQDKTIPMVDAVLATIPALVTAQMLTLTRVAEIKVGKAPAVKMDRSHKMLPTIVQALVAGSSPFIVGPAGSGKTTLAEQCAKVLKAQFYFASRVTSEFKLLGFTTATGQVVRTQFREAYEKGGVFLFDEVDASDPDAMTAFNAGLSNDHCDFPDGMVKRHKDFYAIAAGNTYGRGADRQYVGRNQLDAATLDRFEIFEVDYDEQLEHELAGNLEWSTYVQQVRHQIANQQIRHIVSPRASIKGARMLAAGMTQDVVANACIWKGLDHNVRQRIEGALT